MDWDLNEKYVIVHLLYTRKSTKLFV